ncbi:MAG: hypothetical protein R3E58_11035 [Phycisphaerae bacterium]
MKSNRFKTDDENVCSLQPVAKLTASIPTMIKIGEDFCVRMVILN